MSEAIYAMALLACPAGMGLMMWFMMRGGKQSAGAAPAVSSDIELASLRAELDQLRAEQRDRDVPHPAFSAEREVDKQ